MTDALGWVFLFLVAWAVISIVIIFAMSATITELKVHVAYLRGDCKWLRGILLSKGVKADELEGQS